MVRWDVVGIWLVGCGELGCSTSVCVCGIWVQPQRRRACSLLIIITNGEMHAYFNQKRSARSSG